jgi:DNA replication protein DnaC
MLNEPIIQRLQSMRLFGMAEALQEQQASSDLLELSFDERFALLIDRQYLQMQERALRNWLRYASLSDSGACLEDINYRLDRSLSRERINVLSGPEWIRQGRTALITGATGLGKSYLAEALARQACRNGFRTLGTYSPKLFRSLSAGELDGSLPKTLKKLASCQLLVIDDFGMEKAKPGHYRLFLEVLHDRIGRAATLVTSQYAAGAWHGIIGDDTVADAITDRLAHAAYRLELRGDSVRPQVA